MEKTVENHFNITVSGKQILDKGPGETETIYTQGVIRRVEATETNLT